jgi:hypothetical chaperone protein
MPFGLDFGTTNSSIAHLVPDGTVRLAQFPFGGGVTEAFRSLLYLEKTETHLHSWSGPAAIERYLDADPKGRLIQSLKSFLTSRTLRGTEIFGRQHTIESLIARILRDIREEAERQFGLPIDSAHDSIVVGRPVRFVGAESEADNDFALARLRVALKSAGFGVVRFEMEPVGAAYYYESTLDHDELILIGDFGGGTSDFSLLRVGPNARNTLLGAEGVGLAGDAFDAKIVRHLVAPSLGSESQIRSLDKLLPMPKWVYAKLERWHHLSFLKTRSTLTMLHDAKRDAEEPEKIGALLHLINEDLGYQLHQSVQRVKCALSESDRADFSFIDGRVKIAARVTRREFEKWIAEELHAVESAIDRLMKATGVAATQVDAVFLTGGTSFVPAVRHIFDTRFGASKIRTGNEFTSVARGLALRASARD